MLQAVAQTEGSDLRKTLACMHLLVLWSQLQLECLQLSRKAIAQDQNTIIFEVRWKNKAKYEPGMCACLALK